MHACVVFVSMAVSVCVSLSDAACVCRYVEVTVDTRFAVSCQHI